MDPKVMFEFQRSVNRFDLPTRYRVVDKAGVTESNEPDDTNAVTEKCDGYDAMRQARWVKAGDEGVRAMLNELIYYTVTQNNSSPSVRTATDPGVGELAEPDQ